MLEYSGSFSGCSAGDNGVSGPAIGLLCAADATSSAT